MHGSFKKLDIKCFKNIVDYCIPYFLIFFIFFFIFCSDICAHSKFGQHKGSNGSVYWILSPALVTDAYVGSFRRAGDKIKNL